MKLQKNKNNNKTEFLSLRVSQNQKLYLENNVTLEEIRELLFNPEFVKILRNKNEK